MKRTDVVVSDRMTVSVEVPDNAPPLVDMELNFEVSRRGQVAPALNMLGVPADAMLGGGVFHRTVSARFPDGSAAEVLCSLYTRSAAASEAKRLHEASLPNEGAVGV